MSHNKAKGQTILEVLLAVMLITVTFVGLYSLSSGSIKQTSYSRNLSLAGTYTSEASDWLYNAKRSYGYEAIATKFDQDSGASSTVTYCLITLPSTSALFAAMTPGNCNQDSYITGTIFIRTLTIDVSQIGNDIVEATITTTWVDNTSPGSTQVVTIGKTI